MSCKGHHRKAARSLTRLTDRPPSTSHVHTHLPLSITHTHAPAPPPHHTHTRPCPSQSHIHTLTHMHTHAPALPNHTHTHAPHLPLPLRPHLCDSQLDGHTVVQHLDNAPPPAAPRAPPALDTAQSAWLAAQSMSTTPLSASCCRA